MKKLLLLWALGLSLVACRPVGEISNDALIRSADSFARTTFDADYMTLGVLYYQRAAETRALYYQGFNVARMMIDLDLKANNPSSRAVVLDIDETALDNSPYEAQCVLGSITYPERWDEWVLSASAEATPGSVEFLKYAADKGYAIFYVSNRKEKFREATLKNLAALGFPMADTDHLLLKTAENTKEPRRQQVLKSFTIALLMGDNLADFSPLFDECESPDERTAATDKVRQEFGSRFIVFPNSMYGDWEMILYPDPAASASVKDSLRKANLRGF